MANYLGYEFIDPAEVIFFDENGEFMADKTDEVLSRRLADVERALSGRKKTEALRLFPEEVPISQVPLWQGR